MGYLLHPLVKGFNRPEYSYIKVNKITNNFLLSTPPMSSIGKNKAIEVCRAGSSFDMNADSTNPVVMRWDKLWLTISCLPKATPHNPSITAIRITSGIAPSLSI